MTCNNIPDSVVKACVSGIIETNRFDICLFNSDYCKHRLRQLGQLAKILDLPIEKHCNGCHSKICCLKVKEVLNTYLQKGGWVKEDLIIEKEL